MQSDSLQCLADGPTGNGIAGAIGERFIGQLIARGRLAPELADRVERVRAESSDRLAGILLKLGILSEADLAAELVEFLRLPYVDGDELSRATSAFPVLTSEFLRAHEVFPLAMDEPTLRFACWDALDELT